MLDRARIVLDDVRLEAGCQRGREKTLEVERARWEARMMEERERWEAQMDILQVERDELMREATTLRAQMATGGGMDEMRQLRADLAELRERVRF